MFSSKEDQEHFRHPIQPTKKAMSRKQNRLEVIFQTVGQRTIPHTTTSCHLECLEWSLRIFFFHSMEGMFTEFQIPSQSKDRLVTCDPRGRLSEVRFGICFMKTFQNRP